MMYRCLAVLSLLTLGATATGCTHVRPYEREIHARMETQLDERGEAAAPFEAHVWTVREGATGGDGQAGGGCGCN